MPAIVVWVLRFQIAVVYVMAGVAKLNGGLVGPRPADGDVARVADRHGRSWGWLFDEPWLGRLASWLGAAFDLTIVGWLLWRRTRLAAWIAA